MSETNEDSLNALRVEACRILSSVGSNPSNEQISQYHAVLDEFLQKEGSKEDYIVRVGEMLFDYFVKGGSHDRSYQGNHSE